MNNQNKSNSSSLPFAIIGLVLLAAIVGGWWFYSNSKSSAGKSTANKKADSTNFAEVYAKASPGAQPPNSLGASNAAVTIEEFADFQCPTCAAMHPVVKEMRSSYGDRVRVVFRNFPLNIPQHDKAYDAAVAVEAAGLQGRFWDMQNLLFTNQQNWSRSGNFRQILQDYAQKIGLDVDKFNNDMAGYPARTRVDADIQRGRSLGVGSTPSFYINGRPVGQEGLSSEGMRRLIDAELQRVQPK